jgi:ribonucleoside-diphosphate reductase alpha chain
LRIAAENARRIGLGFMGLADAMYATGIRYGSSEGQEFASQVMEFIRFHAMKTSIDLARERGSFMKIKGSIYDPQNITWKIPEPVKAYERDFGRPSLDWNEVMDGIRENGIRNAAQTTVAPTGTVATVAGVEGYGCEPVFALAYTRNVYQATGDDEKLTLTYTSPLFEKVLDMAGLDNAVKTEIIDKVVVSGTCQNVEEIPEHIRNVFVVSSDITPKEHILMQASIQAFVDNSISKTCNFPESATREDVAEVYMQGWELGCKGLTVYVAGSREEIVLETMDKKGAGVESESEKSAHALPVERGYKLSGSTYKVQTPQGKAFIVVNRDENDNPFEVFVNVGKAGTDVAALSEALGRLVSGWLRSSSDPLSTVKELIVQLIGIGGANSVGFGKNRVSSIPDAVAQVLAEDLDIYVRPNGSNIIEETKNEVSVFAYANMCPECGNSSIVQEEGCSKCYICGYSIC